MKTISLLNLKGGVGKTTTAINLAKGLANKGKQVLLIDTDMQANATIFMIENKMLENNYKDISKLLLDKENKVSDFIYNVTENLDMIGASLEISNTELQLKSDYSRNQLTIIKNWIETIKNDYDYCIIDCPPTINLITINVILASDEIIIPIKIDRFALHGYNITKQNIEEIQRSYQKKIKYKILYTMVNRNNIDRNIIDSIKDNTFNSTIRFQAKPITESSFKKISLIDSKKSSVKEDYELFIKEYLKGER